MRARATAVAVALALAGLGSACSDEATTTPVTTAPPATSGAPARQGWRTTDPASVGLDEGVLAEMASEAEANGSNCLLVVRHGLVAGEWYWQGTGEHSAQEVFSATKSVTSTLVGIAQADGDLDIDDPAATWIPEWRGTPAEAVTVRDLLSNDSGRQWSFTSDYRDLLAARDRTAYAIGLEQADPPGTVWAYNNAAIQTLEQVLEQATGQPLPSFAADRLLDPLGMQDSTLQADPAGNGLAFMGLQSTCRDMARFGQLVLDQGRWGDEQIVPATWIEEATGAPSQDLNAAYGLLWWLNRRGPQAGAASPIRIGEASAVREGQMVEGAPEDLVWALGLGGQIVQVHRATDTVVVRLGPADLSPDYDPSMTARLVTDGITGR